MLRVWLDAMYRYCLFPRLDIANIAPLSLGLSLSKPCQWNSLSMRLFDHCTASNKKVGGLQGQKQIETVGKVENEARILCALLSLCYVRKQNICNP